MFRPMADRSLFISLMSLVSTWNDISVDRHLPKVGADPLCLELGHLPFDQFTFFRCYRAAQDDGAFAICHRAAPSFLHKGLGVSQQAILCLGERGSLKQNSQVWPHLLCLLYAPPPVNTMPEIPSSARKIPDFSKRKGRQSRPGETKTEDAFTHPPFLSLIV